MGILSNMLLVDGVIVESDDSTVLAVQLLKKRFFL